MTKESFPTVTVIMPTFNRAHLVGHAIQSVLDQTYHDFELIVVDDGSTDNTEEVVQGFGDPRIRFIRHAGNRGAGAARNTGIRAALGKYIAFQDSDSEWLPHKLERQMAVFKLDGQNRLGLVLCDLIMASGSKGERILKPRMHRLTYEDLLYPAAHGVGTVAFLLKRDLTAPELHFDERLPALQDWELLLRVSRLCRIGYVAEPLARHYNYDEPHIHTARNVLEAHFVVRRKYAAELQARPKALSFSHWQIALNYYRLGEMGHVRLHLKAAIQAYPWHPFGYLNFATSVFGRQGFWLFLTVRRLLRLLREMVVAVTTFFMRLLKQRRAKEQEKQS